MSILKQKINIYLAVTLILLTGLVLTFLIWTSLNQPSGLDIADASATYLK